MPSRAQIRRAAELGDPYTKRERIKGWWWIIRHPFKPAAISRYLDKREDDL